METLINGSIYTISSTISIKLLVEYESKRSGADMLYRFHYKLYISNSGAWYTNTLRLKLFLNNKEVFSKDNRSFDKGWSFEETTEWFTVSSKISGTTPFYVMVNDILDSTWCQYTSSTYNLYVSSAYTSISEFSVSKISGYSGITAVKINWKTVDIIDYLWYSIDNGSNWTRYDVSDGTSGSFNVTGLSPNTGYNFKIRVRRKDSQLTTDSGAYYQATYDYNKITSSYPNVSNGSTLRVTGTNPSGATCKVKIEVSGAARLSSTGTDVTFSASDINSLMQYYPSDKTFTIRAVVCTLDGSGTERYWSYLDGTYTITNSNPIFNDFDYCDNNSTIVSLTGSNAYLVKNKSNLKVIIPSSKKMTAQNYATPSSYRVEVSNLTGTIAYSTNDVSIDLGKINLAGTLNLSVSAIDSRGNITTKTKKIYIIDYNAPVQSVSIERLNGFENTTTVNIGGSFSLITCGSSNKNTIKSVRYRYKESTSATWNSWNKMTHSISNNTYSCVQQVLTLDNEKSYNFEVEVVDNLETINLPYFVAQGIPIEFINATRKNVGIGCFNDNEEYSLAVRGNIYLKSGNAIVDYEVVDTW